MSFQLYRPDWMQNGNCRGQRPEIFVPTKDKDDKPTKYTEAHECCVDCPVKIECRDYAVETNQLGFWGDTTESDRRKIRRNRGVERWAS